MSRPDISLGVKPLQLDSPVDSAQRILTIKSLLQNNQLAQQQEQLNSQNIEEGKVKQRQIARAEKGMQIYADLVKNAVKIGDDGQMTVDHNAIDQGLISAGYPEIADTHRQHQVEVEKAAYEVMQKKMDVASAQTKQLGSLAQSILNAPEADRPRLYTGAINQAASSGLIPKEAMSQLPQQYTPEVAPLLQQMYDHAQSDPYKAFADRAKEKRDQAEAEAKLKTDNVDLEKKSLDNESQMLGAARTPEAWAAALDRIPAERRNLYPTEYSEQNRARAVFMGMSPDQREKVGKASSKEELAQMAAQGDKTAKTALDILKNNAISEAAGIEAAKLGIFGSPTAKAGAVAAGTLPAGQRDESALNGVDPGVSDMVRGLVEGKRPYPSTMAQKSAYWAKILELAGKYEPGWDATIWKQRSDTIHDFTSGKAATAVRALNTVAQHLKRLNDSVDMLDNSEGDSVVATGMNYARNALMNKKAQNQMSIDRDAVANELENAYRAGGGSEEGVKSWKQNFSVDNAKDIQKNGVKEVGGLIEGLVQSLYSQYEKSMGKQADFNILDKKARDTFKTLGINVDQIDADKKPAASAAPKIITPDLVKKTKAQKGNENFTDEQIMKALEGRGYVRPQ